MHINEINAETKWVFHNAILKYLDWGYANDLEYIVFDDGPVDKILRFPDCHRLQKQPSIDSISPYVLLQDRALNWVGGV